MATRKQKRRPCLTEGCNTSSRIQGVCKRCMRRHRNRIVLGVTTEEQLIEDGELLPYACREGDATMPPAEERAAIKAEIQAEWSEKETAKRAGGRRGSWEVPVHKRAGTR